MKRNQQILDKIKAMLLDMGFSETMVTNPYRSTLNYVYGDLYCVPQYAEKLGFIVEYAHSYDEAEKHWYGDGDAFPLSMGEDAILNGIKQEVLQTIGI